MKSPQHLLFHTTRATAVGRLAYEQFSSARSGFVKGLTSKGAFIELDTGRVLFLTIAPFRGPYTINLLAPQGAMLDSLTQRSPLECTPHSLTIPTVNTTILIGSQQVWDGSPAFVVIPLGWEDSVRHRLHPLAESLFAAKPESGLAPLLPILSGSQSHPPPNPDLEIFLHQALNFKQGIASASIPTCLEAMKAILGLGRGLTPSGDDFTCGVLLVLNRGFRQARSLPWLPELNRLAVDLAARMTTTLSANLVEAATLGLADERVTGGVDHLMTGEPPLEAASRGLRIWGNSSGVDAAAGMITALTALLG